jgi:hypothetical protein
MQADQILESDENVLEEEDEDLEGDDPSNWRYKRAYFGAQDDPNMRDFYFLQVRVCTFVVQNKHRAHTHKHAHVHKNTHTHVPSVGSTGRRPCMHVSSTRYRVWACTCAKRAHVCLAHATKIFRQVRAPGTGTLKICIVILSCRQAFACFTAIHMRNVHRCKFQTNM